MIGHGRTENRRQRYLQLMTAIVRYLFNLTSFILRDLGGRRSWGAVSTASLALAEHGLSLRNLE